MTDLVWVDSHHRELSAHLLYEVLALRNRVFVVEQQCCYQDIDGLDLIDETRHLYATAAGTLVAYARLLAPTRREPVRIGRVIVAPDSRGVRLGHELMGRALTSCAEHWPGRRVGVSAQAHLTAFYAGLGFEAVSEPYDDEGIPHVDMLLGPA